MDKASVNINAKINLSLNVTGVSNNGYHYLDMVVASVNIADAIAISRRSDNEFVCRIKYGNDIKIIGEIPPDENTAIKAARLVAAAYGIGGLDIEILKEIPIMAGLGGSSADAAGVIAAACKMYGIDINSPTVLNIASKCGADVALQLTDGYKRMIDNKDGTQRIDRIETDNVFDLVIAQGAGGVSTAECYREYDAYVECNIFDEQNNISESLGLPDLRHGGYTAPQGYLVEIGIRHRELRQLKYGINNALLPPALKLNPDIGNTLKRIMETEPEAAGMTGSGSACFGIYKNEKEAAAAANKLKDLHYVRAARTVL